MTGEVGKQKEEESRGKKRSKAKGRSSREDNEHGNMEVTEAGSSDKNL